MHIDEQINLLLDMALDFDTPDAAQTPLLQACEALLEPEVEAWAQDEADALTEYQRAYDGKNRGLAERREVSLPDCLTAPYHNWSYELLRRLAKRERMRDDAMYAHCAALIYPRPLSGA